MTYYKGTPVLFSSRIMDTVLQGVVVSARGNEYLVRDDSGGATYYRRHEELLPLGPARKPAKAKA